MSSRGYDFIFFDCDSTLSTIEGIDELARMKGKFDEVKSMTDAAMEGEVYLQIGIRQAARDAGAHPRGDRQHRRPLPAHHRWRCGWRDRCPARRGQGSVHRLGRSAGCGATIRQVARRPVRPHPCRRSRVRRVVRGVVGLSCRTNGTSASTSSTRTRRTPRSSTRPARPPSSPNCSATASADRC